MEENSNDDLETKMSAGLEEALEKAMGLANEGDLEQAIQVCQDTIATYPTSAEPYFVLAVIAFSFGDEGQAILMAEQAHNKDPDTREYAQVLSTISARVGRLTDSVYYAKIAQVLDPHPLLSKILPQEFLDFETALHDARLSVHGIEGRRLLASGHFEKALQEFNAELRINPDDKDTLLYAVRTANLLGQHTQASGAAQALLRLSPENAMAHAALARALVRLGRESEAIASAKTAIQKADDDAEAYSAAMEALQLCVSMDGPQLKTIAEAYQRTFDEHNEPETPEVRSVDVKDPVRIGFVSNAFFRCRESERFASWFSLPEVNEIVYSGYQQSVNADTITTLIKSSFKHWREIHGIDPFTLSMTLRSDELDAMVDVSRIDGETNASLMGLKTAIVGVGTWALPEPGLNVGITHVLSDKVFAAVDEKMLLDGQQLIIAERSLMAREPMLAVPQDTPSPVSESGAATFGALADLPFLSPQFAFAAAEILRRTPNSELLLFARSDFGSSSKSKVREYFLNAGVAERIKFVHTNDDIESDELEDALGRIQLSVPIEYWRAVDVFLDTFPLNGSQALGDALWCGVPVVSRSGDRRAKQMGAAVLTAAGRENWICHSDEAFVETAISLASDSAEMATTRKALQAEIASSELFDQRSTALAIRNALASAILSARAELILEKEGRHK